MLSSVILLAGCGVLRGPLAGVVDWELRPLRAVRRDDGVDIVLGFVRLCEHSLMILKVGCD